MQTSHSSLLDDTIDLDTTERPICSLWSFSETFVLNSNRIIRARSRTSGSCLGKCNEAQKLFRMKVLSELLEKMNMIENANKFITAIPLLCSIQMALESIANLTFTSLSLQITYTPSRREVFYK